MYRIAPEEAAALRKDLERHTNVTYTDKDVLSTLKADLTAADAAAAWQLINEMAATVCRRDPRTRGQKRAAAYVALLHQESSMACMCEPTEDNPCTADTSRPDRRAPLTVITVDLATLAGLLSNPAHLSGHGTIDAEYARELADNAHWQILLTEARNLAEQLGYGEDLKSLIDLDTENCAGTEDKGAESRADSSSGNSTNQSGSRAGQKKSRGSKARKTRNSRSEGSASHAVFHSLGRGRRRVGGSVPRPTRAPKSAQPPRSTCVASPYRGTYTFVAELEAAIAADPALGLALYPDGHGGLVLPPPGALVYRPTLTLAERIRYRDRTCRHPGCDVPAQQCEIDHIVPYFHRNPSTGGWTIDTNLHCLCRYHHSLETMGLWTPVMLADGVEFWISDAGTTAVTVPGTTQLADFGHLPKIHPRPKEIALQPDSSTQRTPEPQATPMPASSSEDEPPPF